MCTVWPCQLDEWKLQCSIAARNSHTHIKHKWHMPQVGSTSQNTCNTIASKTVNSLLLKKPYSGKYRILLNVSYEVPCLKNIFGLKEATPDECCSALPSTVQRNFRTPFMYTKVKDTERMSHRVPCMYYMLQSQVSISSQCTTVMGWDTKICGTCHTVPSRPMAHRNSRWQFAPATRSTMDSFGQNFVLQCFTVQIAALQHTDVLQEAQGS